MTVALKEKSSKLCLCTSNWMIVFSFTSMSLVVMECSPSSLETNTKADSSSALHQSHTQAQRLVKGETFFESFITSGLIDNMKKNAVKAPLFSTFKMKCFSYSPVFW